MGGREGGREGGRVGEVETEEEERRSVKIEYFNTLLQTL